MAKNTDLLIVLDGEGKFVSAVRTPLKNVMIPCTEKSASRTIARIPHPLHDDFTYLLPDGEGHDAYIAQLTAWSFRHPKVEAVRRYIEAGTLPDDLKACEIDASGKLFVRFSVEIDGDITPNLWEDFSISAAWQEHCAATSTQPKTLCYATGELSPRALSHPKGVNPAAGNAKLISCNDETNFTYKGRFTDSSQANSIGVDASHKAHALLKFLIATQGHNCGTQAVVAWAVKDGKALPPPFEDTPSLTRELSKATYISESDIFDDAPSLSRESSNDGFISESDIFEDTPSLSQNATKKDTIDKAKREELGFDCAAELRKTLDGYGSARKLANFAEGCRAAVIAVDAATTGRLGIVFYQDLSENEYIERIMAWHRSCRWWFVRDKKDFVFTPHTDSIISAVYGEPKGDGKNDGYMKLKKQARLRMLSHVVCKEPMERAWVNAAVLRVSNPFTYSKKDGGWNKAAWENAVSVTCAIAKSYYERKMEEISLEIDESYSDRSYLFGRLLALAERIESHARFDQTKGDDTEKRPTNAVRYMTRFASKPVKTFAQLTDLIKPYRERLERDVPKSAYWYQSQIDAVMSKFITMEDYKDNPLDGKYLMGYSLQRRALSKKREEEKNELNA